MNKLVTIKTNAMSEQYSELTCPPWRVTKCTHDSCHTKSTGLKKKKLTLWLRWCFFFRWEKRAFWFISLLSTEIQCIIALKTKCKYDFAQKNEFRIKKRLTYNQRWIRGFWNQGLLFLLIFFLLKNINMVIDKLQLTWNSNSKKRHKRQS